MKKKLFLFGLIFILGSQSLYSHAYVSNQVPDVVLSGVSAPQGICSDGQKLFVSNGNVYIYNSLPTTNSVSPNVSLDSIGLNSALGVYSDGTKLFIADTGNYRVLIYNSIPVANNLMPDIVLSQSAYPYDVSGNGTKLFVTGPANGCLIYNSIPINGSATPDVNLNGLSSPCSAASDGTKLIVANQGSGQIFIYNSIPTTNATSPNVIISGFNVNYNIGVACKNGKLFVSEAGNNRIVCFSSIPTSSCDISSATSIINGLNFPKQISFDGVRLCVADQVSNKVKLFFPAQVANVFPDYGMAGTSTKITTFGFCNTSAMKLTRFSSMDIVSTGVVKQNDWTYTYTLDLSTAAPNYYDITITANTFPRIAKQAFCVLAPVIAPVNWQMNDIGVLGGVTISSRACDLKVGDADYDNNQELYLVNGENTIYQIKKYAYGWSSPIPLSVTNGENYSQVMFVDGDADQYCELYAGTFSTGVYQLKGNLWIKSNLGTVPSGLNKIYTMTKADVDHDGVNEMYVAGDTGVVCQWVNTGTAWSKFSIPGSPTSIITNMLVAGDGNNDYEQELYSANSDNRIYQYRYNGTSWQVTTVGPVAPAELKGVAVGDGDNDGTKEVYAACQDGRIYQYKWNGSSWNSLLVSIGSPGTAGMNSVAISDGDNEGLNEIFATCSDGSLFMYKKSSGTWTTEVLGNAGTPLYTLTVGDPDNDHHFEIYAIGYNNHLYQFKDYTAPTPTPTVTPVVTVAPTLTPTITPTPFSLDKFLKVYRSKINPNRGDSAMIRWAQPQKAPVTITVYNMVGEKIITLVDHQEYLSGQLNEVTWKGVNSSGSVVGSGIYIVHIKTEGYETYSKIAVIK